MDDKVSSVITPPGRASYPFLFKARAFGDNPEGEKKYSLVMIFDKDVDLTPLKKLAASAAEKKWGSKIPKKIDNPIRDGNQEEGEEFQDKNFIRLSAKESHPPKVVDQDPKKVITAESGRIYPGCWVRASVTAYAWEYGGKVGINFGLRNVQFVRDDEPFDGSKNPEDEFESVASADGADEGGDEGGDDLFN